MAPREQLITLIVRRAQQLLRDKGLKPVVLTESTHLLDGSIGIDSLDLAAIVVDLQNNTGKDPFENGFVPFSTMGELVDLYAG